MKVTWWARSPLRTKIFLAFSGLILALLSLTLWMTQLMVSRQVQDALRGELLTTGQVFQGLLQERAERFLRNGGLLVKDFAFVKAMSTSRDPEEYDPSTLASVADNYQRRIGADLLWIISDAGTLLADSRDMLSEGTDLSTFPLVAETFDSGEGAWGITDVGGALLQLVAVPVIVAGTDVLGAVVLGREIDNALARQLEKDTGSHISFLMPDRLFASSWPLAQWTHLSSAVRSLPDEPRDATQGTFLLVMDGERFLSILVPLAARLPSPLYALIQRSYDGALRPWYTLRQRMIAVGVGAVLVALFIGGGLAGGITAPIRTLVAGMHDVLTGQLGRRLPVTREDEVGFLAHAFNEMVEGLEEKEKIRETFGRFVSRDVAEAVLNEPASLAGERREVSILFQDIRGFTTLSERTNPEVLVRVLNQFFTEMVAAVEAEGGVVKQFTGDGVMALFGAPVSHPDDPERAVRAALGMVHRLASLNDQFRSQNIPPLRIGVGVHTGEVVAGCIGPDERVEYAVVGDPVNVASRIEGLTKEMDTTILISEATAARLGPDFFLGRTAVLPVKGKEKPVQVVEVLGSRPMQQTPARLQINQR